MSEVERLRKVKADLAALVAHKGYEILRQKLMENAEVRVRSIMEPLDSTTAVGRQEFDKGFVNGIWFCLGFVELYTAHLERELAQAKENDDAY